MNYKNFNIHLDEHLHETFNKIMNDLENNHEYQLSNNKEKMIYKESYYQGFNDAISLLTNSFK